jgi:hypothetical protein
VLFLCVVCVFAKISFFFFLLSIIYHYIKYHSHRSCNFYDTTAIANHSHIEFPTATSQLTNTLTSYSSLVPDTTPTQPATDPPISSPIRPATSPIQLATTDLLHQAHFIIIFRGLYCVCMPILYKSIYSTQHLLHVNFNDAASLSCSSIRQIPSDMHAFINDLPFSIRLSDLSMVLSRKFE